MEHGLNLTKNANVRMTETLIFSVVIFICYNCSGSFVVIQCPPLLEVDNYNVSHSEHVYKTVVNVSCTDGSTYTAGHLDFIVTTCSHKGEWTPRVAVCKGKHTLMITSYTSPTPVM